MAASGESIGVARSTDNVSTRCKNPIYTVFSWDVSGSTARLESECVARLLSLAHVPTIGNEDPVLRFVKYSTLITSLKVTSASSAHNEAHGSMRVIH